MPTSIHNAVQLPIRVHAWGTAASFTRYDTPAEADTYPMLTPVAADGILTSIYWHPGLAYEIRRIDLLVPVQLYSRNHTELQRTPGPSGIDVSQGRTPRSRRYIHQPAYVIHARMTFHPDDNHRDTRRKHLGIFRDRLFKGRVYEQPYFGLRELTCHVEPAPPGSLVPCAVDADLGPYPLHLDQHPDPAGPVTITHHILNRVTGRWDRVREPGHVRPRYFEAQLRAGILIMPPYRQTTP